MPRKEETTQKRIAKRRKIPTNSIMVLHELAYIKEWQYHHWRQDDPLDGVPTVGKVFEIFERNRDAIEKVEHDAVRKEYVITMIGGAWFSTPESKLEELRTALRGKMRGRK